MTPCKWCERSIVGLRSDALFCSQSCRQASHRFGAECVSRRRATSPLRLAYFDPPYPGLADYYVGHPDFAGEVDHAALIESARAFDGCALSTSADALPAILGLCARILPRRVRVAGWFRGARSRNGKRPSSAWEPVIYWGGRALDGAPPDALLHGVRPRTTDPRRVIGAKPGAFAFWMFSLLGALPGDDFLDVYPGSGGIARAWDLYASRAAARRVALDVATPDASRAAARRVAPRRQTARVEGVAFAGRTDLAVASSGQTDPSRLEPRRLHLVGKP